MLYQDYTWHREEGEPDLGQHIPTSADRYLGAPIGSSLYRSSEVGIPRIATANYKGRLGTWLLIAIRKHVNNLSVTLATDIAIECMTDNNNYWN